MEPNITSWKQPLDKNGTSAEPAFDALFGKCVQVLSPHEWAGETLEGTDARLERHARQLTALYRVGCTLATTLEPCEVYRAIYREVAQGLLGAPNFIVTLFDDETEMIHCSFAIVDGEEKDPSHFPPLALGAGPVSLTIRSRQPHIVDLRGTLPQRRANGTVIPEGSERVPESVLYVPMVAGDRVMGVIYIQHYEEPALGEGAMQLLTSLASQVAMVLTNRQLYACEQERTNALALALEKQKEFDRLRTQILRNVSHEFRTPLSIVHGYIQMLDSGELGEPNPEHKEPLRVIARRVKMMCKMVEDFATVLAAKVPMVPSEPVHLAGLVHKLEREFRVSEQLAGLTLKVDIETDVPPVLGCPAQLGQALENLVTNAFKFTPSGGEVMVGLWREADWAVVQVADTGIGIPRDEQERIFERFYQVDGSPTRRFGGVGLGLAVAKEVVEAHDGYISVASRAGRGAKFQVRLPLMLPDPERSAGTGNDV